MDIRIETARPDDIPELLRLLEMLFSIESDFRPDPERQRRGLAELLSRPQLAQIAVARTPDGKVAGMASVQLVISTAEGAPSAWIEDVVVDETVRGTGLGRRLLAAVLDWARQQGATRAQLLADLDNTPALDFYRHLGWEATRLGARRLMLA
ncbi:MAG: GNAT family N-acetyltransferase [Zoogloea sp.]|nr:GNAT family N-acetyltransferase [Zoogloea sp.]